MPLSGAAASDRGTTQPLVQPGEQQHHGHQDHHGQEQHQDAARDMVIVRCRPSGDTAVWW